MPKPIKSQMLASIAQMGSLCCSRSVGLILLSFPVILSQIKMKHKPVVSESDDSDDVSLRCDPWLVANNGIQRMSSDGDMSMDGSVDGSVDETMETDSDDIGTDEGSNAGSDSDSSSAEEEEEETYGAAAWGKNRKTYYNGSKAAESSDDDAGKF